MELFVTVTFWVGLVGAILRARLIAIRSYPVTTEETLGCDLMRLLEQLVFVVWAGVLLWGR